MICHIEIFLRGKWRKAAEFEPLAQTSDRGVDGPCLLQYDVDYAADFLGQSHTAIFPALPVSFELFRFNQWPAFVVDLLPTGAGRRVWIRRLEVQQDGPAIDWPLLIRGAGHPPGNCFLIGKS